MSLTTILNKYKEKKLFEYERYKFREEFFKELFDPADHVDLSLRTTIFINAVLEEENLPFIFSVERESEEGEHKGEMYWYLKKL